MLSLYAYVVSRFMQLSSLSGSCAVGRHLSSREEALQIISILIALIQKRVNSDTTTLKSKIMHSSQPKIVQNRACVVAVFSARNYASSVIFRYAHTYLLVLFSLILVFFNMH